MNSFGPPVAFDPPALPQLNALHARSERILNRWPDVVVSPPEKDRERWVQEVKRRLETDQWRDTPLSLMTSAARALFDEDRRARSDLGALRDFYYAEIRASTRKSFLDAMLSVHLATYAPGAPHTRSLCAALTSARPRLGGIGQTLLQHIPSVLDPVAAPRAIADRMLEMDDCWTGLKACSLRSPHAPGLMDHAHLVFVQKLAPAFQPALEKLFAWLKPPGQPVRMSGAAEAITAVLKPWLTSDPPKDRIASITETLIAFYHDPRVSRSGAWASVPERELAVLLRWLTGENIRFFLDVVSAVEESHMWEPRRKFWLGLYEQKRIDAAWVAFSGRAASLARRQVDAGGKRGLLSFGRQTAGGGRTDTSLLILKIGSKIVVEGSHSYKVHVFSVDDPNAPRLYQPNYDCEHIRSLHGAQAKPHLGDWQGWVRERI